MSQDAEAGDVKSSDGSPPALEHALLNLDRAKTAAAKTVVVLGAPRGGTSMVAGALRSLGVFMGPPDQLGHQHEDPAFRYRERTLGEMVATVQQRDAEHAVWGWKLPNTIYYIEKLHKHLRNPHYLVVYRNPASTALSSATRDGRPFDFRLLCVPINHYAKMHAFLETCASPIFAFGYENVLEARDAFVRRVSDFLGMAPSAEQREAAKAFINPGRGYARIDERRRADFPPAA